MYCSSDGVKQFIMFLVGTGKFIEFLMKSSLFFTEMYSGIQVLFLPKISVKYFNLEYTILVGVPVTNQKKFEFIKNLPFNLNVSASSIIVRFHLKLT